MRVALDPANSLRLRAESTELSIASLEGVSPELFDFLIGLIEPSNAIEIRGAASRSLAQAFLSEDQLFRLIETLGKAGPMELPYIVQAFRNGLSFELGSKMLQGTGELRRTHQSQGRHSGACCGALSRRNPGKCSCTSGKSRDRP